MKKTFKELIDIDNLVGLLYRKFPDLRDSKFGYAYTRFFEKNIQKTLKEYNADLADIRINNALENQQTKAILTDPQSPRGYQYSKEGLKLVIKQETELEDSYYQKEIEVIPFISSYVPEGLTEEQIEKLTGVII